MTKAELVEVVAAQSRLTKKTSLILPSRQERSSHRLAKYRSGKLSWQERFHRCRSCGCAVRVGAMRGGR